MTEAVNYQAKSQANTLRAGLRDLDPALVSHYESYAPYTMTTIERMFGLDKAVEYVVRNKIAGSIVETGVWRGGSMMLVANALKRLGEQRDLWCYDTYEGQPEPDANETDIWGNKSLPSWQRYVVDGKYTGSQAGLEEVKRNILSTGYPEARLHCIKGMVEDTIPAQVPDQIALLRLDTDWYQSVAHGFEHLYPRLAPGGVLIIDDYGHQTGARQATDDYLAKLERMPMLVRVDYSCRMAVKI